MTIDSAAWLRRSRLRCAAGVRRLVVGAADRPVHSLLAALVLGLLCGPRVPALVVVAAAGCIASAVTLALRDRAPVGSADEPAGVPHAIAASAARLGLAAIVALAAGFVASDVRADALAETNLQPLLGHAVTERVEVLEAPRRSPFGGWSAKARLRDEPVLLRVTEASAAALPRPGDLLAVTGGLKPAGEFAQVLRAHAEIRATDARVVGRRGGAAGALDRVRSRAEAALDGGLPPAAAGLLRGMVLGQDDALPDETREAFRAAGLSHLVAASGTNVVLLAALAMALGTALGLGLTGRLWLVLALIAIYVPLAGGGASIQRAGIMGAAAVAAGLVGRPASRWYALGLAAAVTLLLDPRAAEDPGWQLSFVAVLSLLLLAPRWRKALMQRGVPPALAEVTAMTAAATLATAPLVAAHFDQASLVAVPANLLAAPAVAPIMWLGVVAGALGQLVVLGTPVAWVASAVAAGLDGLAGFPLGYLVWVGTTAAALPGAVVQTGPALVSAAVAVVLLLALSARARRRLPVAAGLSVALWVGLAPAQAAPPEPPDRLRITFLDVGQGDATLLQHGRRAVLVDAGLEEAGIVGLLERAGVRRLDLFVATHASADHEGGAASVVSALPVGAILDGRDGVPTPGGIAMERAAAARRVPVVAARAGQVLRLGGLVLRVLWPHPEPANLHAGEDPNGRAVVLEAAADGRRALLTADAESEVLARLELRPVDLLKVAHHGSADPGLPRVLERLRPRVAGIEVGEGNSYGHPAPSTLAALATVPVVVRTDRDGSVRLDLGADGRWEVRAHT